MSSTKSTAKALTFRQCIDTIRDTSKTEESRMRALIRLVVHAEAGLSVTQMHQIADTLQIALLDENSKIAERAIQALNIITPPGTVDILQTEALQNANTYIRLIAVMKLWKRFSDQADFALIDQVAQTDDDKDVRWAAKQALKYYQKERSRRRRRQK